MVKLLFFCFRVTNSRLKNKKFRLELLTRWVQSGSFTEQPVADLVIRQTFIHNRCIISDLVYQKDCARHFSFLSQVCKINL